MLDQESFPMAELLEHTTLDEVSNTMFCVCETIQPFLAVVGIQEGFYE